MTHLNVFPSFTTNDMPHCGFTKAVAFRDGALRLASCICVPNGSDIVNGELGSWICCSGHRAVSTLRHHIRRVLGDGAIEQMGRVAAGRIVAMVAGVFWPIAMIEVVGNAMRQKTSIESAMRKLPISLVIFRTYPWPTCVCAGNHVNASPKQFFKWSDARFVAASLRTETPWPPIVMKEGCATMVTRILEGHSGLLNRLVCGGCRTTNPTPQIIPPGGI